MTRTPPDYQIYSTSPMVPHHNPSIDMSQTDQQNLDVLQQAAPVLKPQRAGYDISDKLPLRLHQHSLSDSTGTVGSNESSPTTTISTIDDSSATETSPGSSPESPPPTTFSAPLLMPHNVDEPGAPHFELQRQPPMRKGRNLKNLAVNTSRHLQTASTSSLPLSSGGQSKLSSAASLAFVKPPSPAKRKPNNLGLTLLTPGSSKAPPQEIRLAIPPTPGLSRPNALRHFQSSPSLPLFPGLALPGETRLRGAFFDETLDTLLSPTEMPKNVPHDQEETQNFDQPLSREDKPEAYPDGPICVYEPNIDLYLEPSVERAREYDVIMNVASEVRNPFTQSQEIAPTSAEIRIDGGGGIQYTPKRLQAAAYPPVLSNSVIEATPTTPRAAPLIDSFSSTTQAQRDPEYVHVPWEHNSDIVPDLLRLVKLIDEKANEGKRVLVHCQCGVSRSASLVVAYTLYKNPSMTVQEAYDAVKTKSKWIGPNMNLIMQLQEFKTSLSRGGLLPPNRGVSPITPSSALSEWGGPFSRNNPPPPSHNIPLSAGAAETSGTPKDAVNPEVSAGPSSAPSALKWPVDAQGASVRPRAQSAVKPPTYVDPSGRLVPLLKIEDSDTGNSDQVLSQGSTTLRADVEQDATTPNSLLPERPASTSASEVSGRSDSAVGTAVLQAPESAGVLALSSPRTAEFAMTALQPPPEVDPADAFGLMSPTSTTFAHSPFDRSALLASLGMGSLNQSPRRSVSLRADRKTEKPTNLPADPSPKLRGKISSPSLREQQQLQSLQAQIEASLPQRTVAGPAGGSDDALMSPRATEFTSNPFALPPPSITVPDDAPRLSELDPRSPAQKGVHPITRNIVDFL